jgi:2-polyprenyl-3-methyl-5-hydroxy-6-metoxy-1,4-benzoquinol methylase
LKTADIFTEHKILESWSQNAEPWIQAVRKDQIESRRLITNQAIIDEVLKCKPQTMLDIGCGEGWLVRQLSSRGVDTLGIDGEPKLIKAAQSLSVSDKYQLMSYQDLIQNKLNKKFDVAVCNFSLIGKDSVEELFANASQLIHRRGYFIVQTLHPRVAVADLPYEDGWREGSWEGFNGEFTNPAPWYFRTVQSWLKLFTDNGFSSPSIIEPLSPETQKPASIILAGQAQ